MPELDHNSDIQAVKLNYTRLGEAGADVPAVILIHGLFGSLSNLGLLGRSLREHYRVYLLDLRNHGESPHSTRMDYPSMAADLLALLDAEGLQKASLVGHSMGGKVAMQMALSYPQRVDKIVLADIAPVRYPSRHDDVLAGLNALAESELDSRRSAEAILQQHITSPDVRAFLLKTLGPKTGGGFELKLNLPAIIASYDIISGPPDSSHGEQPFTGPTLFIKGGKSNYLTEAHRPQVLELFPKAELKIIADTGHWLHAEKPALFNQMVRRFLDPA